MRERVLIAGLLTAELGLLIAVASLGDLRYHVPAFLVLFILACISSLVAIRFLQKFRLPLSAILLIAVTLRVPLFFTQPSLSDDVWRYIHDGRAQLAGINPYQYAPSHKATAAFRGPEYERINHRELQTIYPPASQLAFRAIAAFSNPLLAWRLMLLAAELTMLLMAARFLRRRGMHQNNLALYAWHPLAIIETIGSAHVEAFGILLLVLALTATVQGRQLQAGIAFAASVATKLIAAPIAFIATRGYRLPVAFALTLVILYIPFVVDRTNALGSLGVFAERWESNSSIHALLSPVIGQRNYRLCAAAVLIGIITILRFKNVDLINTVPIYFLALFALAPVVHPWYLLWLLALLPLRRNPFDALGKAALFWTVSVALAYCALHQQQMHGEWRVPELQLMMQYLPVYALLATALVPSPGSPVLSTRTRYGAR
jgi:hypothetical protein